LLELKGLLEGRLALQTVAGASNPQQIGICRKKGLLLGVCEDDSLLGTATKMQGRCLNVHKPVGQKNPKAGRC
jgi:hypothetical protein